MSVLGEAQAGCRVSKLISQVVMLGHHARTGDGSRTFRDDPRGQGEIGQCVQAGAVVLENCICFALLSMYKLVDY